MCLDIYDRYLDCEKDHTIETYHRCLKAYQYVLDINNDGCTASRIIYCLMAGLCPKCEHGSDCFDSAIDTAMDMSDDEGGSEDCWGTTSATEAEASEPET